MQLWIAIANNLEFTNEQKRLKARSGNFCVFLTVCSKGRRAFWGMKAKVIIQNWAAWAPSCSSHEDWQNRLLGDIRGAGQAPDVSFLPPVQRRRLSLLSRMGLWLAHECLQGYDANRQVTSVFASRYGEYDRTFSILTDLANKEPISPGAFSQSVHNTSSGLFSILSGNRMPSSVVSAGPASLEAGFMEAALQAAATPGQDILYIYQDAPLPADYAQLEEMKPDDEAMGLGLLVRASDGADAAICGLNWQPSERKARPGHNQGARVEALVTMLLAGKGELTFDDGRLRWVWTYG